jgi:hypothetical protein
VSADPTIVGRLRELIAALDRRKPHVDRDDEHGIARESAALRQQAEGRIAQLGRANPGGVTVNRPVNIESKAVRADAMTLAACPSCHTTDAAMTYGSMAAGAGWRCGRCGQQWTASRMATVAAYTAWAADRAARSSITSRGGR